MIDKKQELKVRIGSERFYIKPYWNSDTLRKDAIIYVRVENRIKERYKCCIFSLTEDILVENNGCSIFELYCICGYILKNKKKIVRCANNELKGRNAKIKRMCG